MPLLADYVITPDVFDATCYGAPEECEARIDTIRPAMLTEGLVRNLYGGQWREQFTSNRHWHRRGLELVKKLDKQGRLIASAPALSAPPANDSSWCTEALAAHAAQPLTGGVIVTAAVKSEYSREPLVAGVDRLTSAPWWNSRGPSVRLQRTYSEYARNLDLLLRQSNSLLFIDPYLDPEEPNYSHFGRLLALAGNRTPAPSIQLHRAYRIRDEGFHKSSKSGRASKNPAADNFTERFRSTLSEPLSAAGLTADVFIWDNFHDRYLISNLIGISLPHGFDTTTKRYRTTSWTRLSRNDRDDVGREFHPNARRRKLVNRFRVP